MSRASVLAPAREGALVDGCDLSVDEAPSTAELVRDGGGEMVSKHPHHPTEPGRLPRTGCLTLGSVGPVDVLFNLASTSYSTGSRTSLQEEWDRADRDEVNPSRRDEGLVTCGG